MSKSFLQKMKGVFIEDVPTTSEKESAEPSKITSQPASIWTGGNVPEAAVSPSISGSQTSEFCERLNKLMEEENKRNFPGIDYYEFVTMKDAMSGIPSEELKCQSAFAGLATSGLTKDKLLSTANDYIGVVEREEKEFSEAYDHAYDSEVTAKSNEVKLMEEEVRKLGERIVQLNSEMGKLKNESLERAGVLSAKKAAFELAVKSVKGRIQEEIGKINLYIK